MVGLPGTGKTTAIKEFINKNSDLSIKYLDIADYTGKYRTSSFKEDVKSGSGNLIAESATGFFISDSITIHYKKPLDIITKNLIVRGEMPDYDYLSLQAGQIIPSQYTIRKKSEFIALLEKIYKKEC